MDLLFVVVFTSPTFEILNFNWPRLPRAGHVAPAVATQITDLGIQPGERFQVRKQVKRQGSRRLIEWDVERVAHEPETQLERELRESIAVAQTAKSTPPSEVTGESEPQPPPLESAPPNATPAPAAASMSNTPRDGNASAAPQNGLATTLEDTIKPAISADHARTEVGSAQECLAPPVPAPTPAAVPIANGSANGSQSSPPRNGNNPPPVTTKLEHALKTAISAAYNAEKYSAELGYVVRFDADAIKSMAITVLINMSEGNRR